VIIDADVVGRVIDCFGRDEATMNAITLACAYRQQRPICEVFAGDWTR